MGSPLKKARASLSGMDGEIMGRRLGLGLSGGGALGPVGGGDGAGDGGRVKREEDEEL